MGQVIKTGSSRRLDLAFGTRAYFSSTESFLPLNLRAKGDIYQHM